MVVAHILMLFVWDWESNKILNIAVIELHQVLSLLNGEKNSFVNLNEYLSAII